MSFEGAIKLDDEPVELKATRIGEVGQKEEDLLKGPEVMDAAREGNPYDVMINICKKKFDETIVDQIDKYLNFREVLDKEKGFAVSLHIYVTAFSITDLKMAGY